MPVTPHITLRWAHAKLRCLRRRTGAARPRSPHSPPQEPVPASRPNLLTPPSRMIDAGHQGRDGGRRHHRGHGRRRCGGGVPAGGAYADAHSGGRPTQQARLKGAVPTGYRPGAGYFPRHRAQVRLLREAPRQEAQRPGTCQAESATEILNRRSLAGGTFSLFT